MVIRPAAPGLFRVVCPPEGGDKGEGEDERYSRKRQGNMRGEEV